MAGLETNSEYGETAQAVSLGLAVLRKCKQNSWDGLVAAMAADDVTVIKAFQAIDLDDDQLDLMGRRQPEIGLIRISPAVVPAICPSCGMFILTSDTAPSKCQVTAGCEGKPAKVAAAKATKAPSKPAVAKVTVAVEAADPAQPMSIDEAVGALAGAVEELHEVVSAKEAADNEFDAVAEAVIADFEAERRAENLSLEDLAEDFSELAPVPVAARSSKIVLDDDNGFD